MPVPQQEQMCPLCGGKMIYRLGEYECSQCGHVKPAPPKEEPSTSRPGLKQGQWESGNQPQQSRQQGGYSLPGQYMGGSPPVAPPPPPPGSSLYGQPNIYGSPYEDFSTPPRDSLDMEKKIYFGIQVAFSVVSVILAILFAGVVASLGGSSSLSPDVSGVMGFAVFGSILGTIVSLSILWYVLFGDQLWLKWTCSGCAALSLLLILFVFCIPAEDVVAGQVRIIDGIFQLGMLCWFLSILWRDIQRMQTYR